eukprot:SAG31_NODE_1807_length_7230_cov_4.804885_7_plen_85_part_00
MPFFFLLSGFVMTLAYGSKPVRCLPHKISLHPHRTCSRRSGCRLRFRNCLAESWKWAVRRPQQHRLTTNGSTEIDSPVWLLCTS